MTHSKKMADTCSDTKKSSDKTHEEKSSKEEYEEITEGKAKILFPKANTVFYNNVQVFNRDLSVAVIKRFVKEFNTEKDEVSKRRDKKQRTNIENDKGKSIKSESTEKDNEKIIEKSTFSVLEALSATGLRAVRYALEIEGIDKFIANDLSKEAVHSIQRNIEHNNVGNLVKSSLSDAR